MLFGGLFAEIIPMKLKWKVSVEFQVTIKYTLC